MKIYFSVTINGKIQSLIFTQNDILVLLNNLKDGESITFEKVVLNS